MQAQDIKRLLIKPLKTNFPNWQRLTERGKYSAIPLLQDRSRGAQDLSELR
jgi:hypothetical protein